MLGAYAPRPLRAMAARLCLAVGHHVLEQGRADLGDIRPGNIGRRQNQATQAQRQQGPESVAAARGLGLPPLALRLAERRHLIGVALLHLGKIGRRGPGEFQRVIAIAKIRHVNARFPHAIVTDKGANHHVRPRANGRVGQFQFLVKLAGRLQEHVEITLVLPIESSRRLVQARCRTEVGGCRRGMIRTFVIGERQFMGICIAHQAHLPVKAIKVAANAHPLEQRCIP
ncbi:Uncharacterised protein [Bordetella pertussis]|nr:Uncharacterised protein [Bordetella pertussis]CFN23031.1 Uncharacterised protein [Bordetella pertussis]CFO69105.1 Uncharacterised protein [Bordetella pertussis]CFT79271.1 Uncharacterised protein [Bordetella pertussis]CFV95966.1 Uncharacterised protein [Bordetella pertussis]